MMSDSTDPDTYVRQNKESLVRVIKHSNDEFVRALCLAALVKYGEEPPEAVVEKDIDRLDQLRDSLD